MIKKGRKYTYSLSFMETLTRNLLLFSVMLIALGVGCAVYFLDKVTLDLYFIKIQSERLSVIFFIIVAACYITLLFVLIKKPWINFFVQLITAMALAMGLLFISSPIVKVSIYAFYYHAEFKSYS